MTKKNDLIRAELGKRITPRKPIKEAEFTNQLFSEAELNLFRFPEAGHGKGYVYLKIFHINRKFKDIKKHIQNWIEIAVNRDYYMNFKKSVMKATLITEFEEAIKILKDYENNPEKSYPLPKNEDTEDGEKEE